MNHILKTSVLAAWLLVPTSASLADVCAFDDRPGATLLLPYFEVDLDDSNGLTTLFTVHNISSEAVFARVVLWTDAAYPTLGFPMLLEAFDLRAINLRDVFNGQLPQIEVAVDPSPCEPPGSFTEFLGAAHTGRPTPELEGLCAGFDRGDRIARGYVTVDVVSSCEGDLLPTDPGYFDGFARSENVLWGDFFYFHPVTRRSEGGLLVSLEADESAFGPGDETFYGRYVDHSGRDAREPLPTLWSNRFLGGGALDIVSRSIVWRDTGALPEAFDCPGAPSWHPLSYQEIISFDEDGHPVFLSTDVAFLVPPEPPFPAATQQGFGFRATAFGWEVLDLNPSPTERRQSFVMELVEAKSGASYMRRATPLDSTCSLEGCGFGQADLARVCLTGNTEEESPELVAGAPIRVRVYPKGCFSSTCTIAYRSLCRVSRSEKGLEAEASFCLRDRSDEGEVCSEDCGGGGFAECAWGEGLSEGEFELRLGGLEIDFSVPMRLPEGGLCAEISEP